MDTREGEVHAGVRWSGEDQHRLRGGVLCEVVEEANAEDAGCRGDLELKSRTSLESCRWVPSMVTRRKTSLQ